MTQSHPLITLTTDFGLKDEYVGAVKGVILSYSREIVLVDITHTISPQDRGAAALLLSRSYSYFPAGTVHLVVVDPGVGSSRQIIAIQVNNHYFVGPDNGVFSFLLKDKANPLIHSVNLQKWSNHKTSNSFHGRDIMAPVAAHLACTKDLADIGPKISIEECVTNLPQTAVRVDNSLRGAIVHVDHFGNLCTNISRTALQNFSSQQCQIRIGDTTIPKISISYSHVSPGSCIALFDSHDFLEIAVNQGNASTLLKAGPGTEVIIEEVTLTSACP